jgi:hypothetical protein
MERLQAAPRRKTKLLTSETKSCSCCTITGNCESSICKKKGNESEGSTLTILFRFIAQQQHGSGEVNTHSVVGYRNAMHKFVGLARIPDPDCPDIAVAVEYVPTFFARFYDMQSILGAIHFALNDRKIAYNAVVSFLQYNRPQTFPDAEDFLYHCFDDEGKFTRGAAAWLLFKIGVFKEVKKDSCDVNKLFPPLSELELSKSRDNVLAKSVEIVENLEQSLGKEEVEELAESNDWAVSHTCDNCR